MIRKKVFVGLSGGVDSSVSALRLKNAGFDVVGVFIKVWQPDFITCSWEEERLDAMRVAAHLSIPFLTFDAESVYKKEVVDYLIHEYNIGRTPNPDILCNSSVKFDAFYNFAKSHGADFIATGHYAQTKILNGTTHLLRGKDSSKDQSYFLYTLPSTILPHVLFPIGDSEKSEVRNEARKAGLLTASKPDSQGICFIGEVSMKEFLRHFTSTKPGDVLDEEGNIIGTHDGAFFYTLGERRGFTLHEKSAHSTPQYVTRKNMEKNTITVSSHTEESSQSFILTKVTDRGLKENTIYSIQTRYRQTPRFAEIIREPHGNIRVVPRQKTSEIPSPGQSCVIYDEDICKGGGIIL